MEKRFSGDGTVVGMNGDLFSLSDGHPTGGLLRGGVLDTAPADARSTIGIDTDGNLHVERVSLAGTWQGSGQRRILGINEPPRASRTTLYTRAWGARTPVESGGAYAILQPFPATKPNTRTARRSRRVCRSSSLVGSGVRSITNPSKFGRLRRGYRGMILCSARIVGPESIGACRAKS